MLSRKLSKFTCGSLYPPKQKNEINSSRIIDNAFKLIHSKILHRQAAGNWISQNIKLGLEVFPNFFPCVYFV